ncbi:winged helix-turn-helix domain-containing protein, partial [Thermus scotoductus]
GKPMADLRHQNPGQPPLLPPELQEAFRQALLQPHPRDGIWTIRNAAEWLSERLGRPVDPRRAWSWMKRLGFAPLRPRPRHRERDLAEGEAFKKTSSSRSFS